ncbi:MAG: invasion associated locus B family protein [Rhizobiaceae bacterium]
MAGADIRFALFVALLAAAPSMAAAQTGLPGGASTLNETHGDWQVACATPENVVRCTISQTQVTGQDRKRLLAVELAAAEGGKAANGALVLPFGLRLDDGVRLAIDDKAEPPVLRFSTCVPAGCVVPLAFDADAVKRLSAGTKLGVAATANEGGQDVAFSVSLSGFTSALARAAELTRAQ